ncbi:MAG: UbiA family prenyltransferase [Planctomycetes bacterium]|nr:UbiA family prenyltransferase [Planctomycetota bacterium]
MHFLLYPGHTLPTAAAPILVAAGLAGRDAVFAPWPLALAFVGSWLIHLAGVFADNHELLRRHADVPEHAELLAALGDGTLTLRAIRLAIAGCLGAAALVAVPAVAIGGWPAVVLGIVGVGASLGYAAGPRYARHGLADPVFLLMFGSAAVAGTYYLQAAAVVPGFAWTDTPWRSAVVGLPVGGLVTAVLVIDDLRDRSADAVKGWRTTAVRHGVAGSRTVWLGLTVGAYLLLPWFWLGLGLGPWVLLAWATAPWAIAIGRDVLRHDATEALRPATPRMALLAAVFAALLGLGLALPEG